jgi:hypothetical protein
VRVREEQPAIVPPMLLTSGAVPDGVEWALEIKWDGCRAQLRYDGWTVSVRTVPAESAATLSRSWQPSPRPSAIAE